MRIRNETNRLVAFRLIAASGTEHRLEIEAKTTVQLSPAMTGNLAENAYFQHLLDTKTLKDVTHAKNSKADGDVSRGGEPQPSKGPEAPAGAQ